MSYFPLPADSAGSPDHGSHGDVVVLGIVAIYAIVFLTLLGYGYDGREAISLTVTLAVAGLEVLRHLPPGSGQGGGGSTAS